MSLAWHSFHICGNFNFWVSFSIIELYLRYVYFSRTLSPSRVHVFSPCNMLIFKCKSKKKENCDLWNEFGSPWLWNSIWMECVSGLWSSCHIFTRYSSCGTHNGQKQQHGCCYKRYTAIRNLHSFVEYLCISIQIGDLVTRVQAMLGATVCNYANNAAPIKTRHTAIKHNHSYKWSDLQTRRQLSN